MRTKQIVDFSSLMTHNDEVLKEVQGSEFVALARCENIEGHRFSVVVDHGTEEQCVQSAKDRSKTDAVLVDFDVRLDVEVGVLPYHALHELITKRKEGIKPVSGGKWAALTPDDIGFKTQLPGSPVGEDIHIEGLFMPYMIEYCPRNEFFHGSSPTSVMRDIFAAMTVRPVTHVLLLRSVWNRLKGATLSDDWMDELVASGVELPAVQAASDAEFETHGESESMFFRAGVLIASQTPVLILR